MHKDNNDSGKPENIYNLSRIIYGAQALSRTPGLSQPVRVGADLVSHQIQHAILEASEHLGLHPDAAYWFDLGLQATLILVLVGWIAASAYKALSDLRDTWIKLRNRHKKSLQPPKAETRRGRRRLRGRRSGRVPGRRGKRGRNARRGFNKHGRRRQSAKSKARGENTGLPKPPV